MGEPDRTPPEDPLLGSRPQYSRRSRAWLVIVWIAVGVVLAVVVWQLLP